MKTSFSGICILCLLLLTSCGRNPKSAMGFRLPDGDVAKGREAFVSLKCTACHEVSGETFPGAASLLKTKLELGGQVYHVETYGQLTTSIMNPSHSIRKGYDPDWVSESGESLMQNFNKEMSVQQMIDLVAFLQSKYKLLKPNYDDGLSYPY